MSSVRRDLLLRTVLEVLVEADGPVPAGDVVALVADRVQLNDYELSHNASGFARFDTSIRFSSGWLKTIGWIEKSEAGWRITPTGQAALTEHGADLYRETSRRYRAVATARASTEDWADPRWRIVREALGLVPEGAWTTYGDLAEVAGLPARSVGTYMSSIVVPMAHRVLTVNGEVASQFKWADPQRTEDPRRLLEAEGVTFEPTGRANAEQRITSDELRDALGLEAGGERRDQAVGPRAWLIRGSSVRGIDMIPTWLEQGFVSVAASQLPLVDLPTDTSALRAAVRASGPNCATGAPRDESGQDQLDPASMGFTDRPTHHGLSGYRKS